MSRITQREQQIYQKLSALDWEEQQNRQELQRKKEVEHRCRLLIEQHRAFFTEVLLNNPSDSVRLFEPIVEEINQSLQKNVQSIEAEKEALILKGKRLDNDREYLLLECKTLSLHQEEEDEY